MKYRIKSVKGSSIVYKTTSSSDWYAITDWDHNANLARTFDTSLEAYEILDAYESRHPAISCVRTVEAVP